MDFEKYGPYILEETAALLAIDSPSGMTKAAADHVTDTVENDGICQALRYFGLL